MAKTDKSENRPKTGKRRVPRTAFRPGQSGNPGGRPKRTPEEFELIRACKGKTSEALDTILALMRSARKESVRLSAAIYLIERAYGKVVPPAASLVTETPVSLHVRFVSPEETRRPQDVTGVARPTLSLDGPHRQNQAYLPSSPAPLGQPRRA